MPQRPPAARLAVLAVLLLPALVGQGARAFPVAADDPDLSHAAQIASCSGTVLPRPTGGVAFSGSPYFAVSRSPVCFTNAELDHPQRVLLRIVAGPTFSGEAVASFGDASVRGTFVAGQLVSGEASTTADLPAGGSTLVLLAGHSVSAAQGGQTFRPLCVPPIEDPGCAVVVQVPFVYATTGALGAAGALGAEVRRP